MNIRKLKAIENSNKIRLIQMFPILTDNSGIYILTREENGIKYAYVGQAKHILTRLAEHIMGYQWIDISIKKHKWYSEDNPTGWKATCIECPVNDLDGQEQAYIRQCIEKGYQMRNRTTGSQGSDKKAIDNAPDKKGYFAGKEYGYEQAKKYMKVVFTKYLKAVKRKDCKIDERKLKEFEEWLDIGGEQ